MFIYVLNSINMTGLGGPMGSERTWSNYRRNFETLEKAKAAAEKEFGSKINWSDNGRGLVTSGDLRFVMYDIRREEVE